MIVGSFFAHRAENAHNTLMQTLILPSNAQPATLAVVYYVET